MTTPTGSLPDPPTAGPSAPASPFATSQAPQGRGKRTTTPYPKDQGPCGCGCGQFGTLKKPNRAGVRCVNRLCKCRSCMGKNNRRKGDRKANEARKALGAIGANSRHEEHWGGGLRIEAKAGAQVGPILTRYLAARTQSEAARAIGDNRPFVMAAMPDRGPGLLVLEIDQLDAVLAAVAENWGAA